MQDQLDQFASPESLSSFDSVGGGGGDAMKWASWRHLESQVPKCTSLRWIYRGKNMPSKYTGSHLLSDRSNLWNFRRRNVSRFEMFWANHPKKSVVWNTFIFHRQVEVPLNDTLSLFVCQVPGAANRFQEMMRCWDPKLGTALQEFPGPFEWMVSMENRKIMRKYGNTMKYIYIYGTSTVNGGC